MPNVWFRLYSEFSHDPKIQMMTEAMQRRYIMLMCLRCSNVTETLQETELAFHLRITEHELAETKALFLAKKFIDKDWNLLNWEKRQYLSDSSTARVRAHREKTRNVTVTPMKRSGNVPDTDTDTEQIQKRPESKETVVSLPGRETDASLGARMLCELIGDRDVRNERAYSDAIKTAVGLGADARDQAQRMFNRWNEYQAAKANLEWGYGSAYKFFMSGMWDKPDQWAWAKGKRPQTKAKKYAEMPGREA